MEDTEILKLFWNRDETAISEAASKYGAFCFDIALRIVSDQEDAEECVNDTFLRAWDSIPPQRPEKFGVWLGVVVRNISLNIWKKNHRQKRYAGMDLILDELSECFGAANAVEEEMDKRILVETLDRWLESLPKKDRVLFVRRYWYGVPLHELADENGYSQNRMAKKMYRLRQELRKRLEEENRL